MIWDGYEALGWEPRVPKCLSPYEKIQKIPTFKLNPNKTQANKKGQKPGCHKPPPLRRNLVLEIRLLGKTILDNVPLGILPVPRLILTRCDAPTGLYKTSLLYCGWLFLSDPQFWTVSLRTLSPWPTLYWSWQSFSQAGICTASTVRRETRCAHRTIPGVIPTDKQQCPLEK